MQTLIGKKAIDFNVPAVLANGDIINDYNLYKNIESKYAFLFFYPMDFTFVCPSELIAINNRMSEFEKRNIEVIAISIDSHYVHKAWRDTSLESGGLGGNIKYTMVSDIKHEIIRSYGLEDEKTGVSFRGSFIIDNQKCIRIQHINDFPIGRNIDEYIRLFDALFFHNKYGQVCQAGWNKGNKGIVPTKDGISDYLSDNHKKL